MKKLLAIIFVSLLLTGSAFAGSTYNQYGTKTGSFKTDSTGRTTQYDRYGKKVESFK